MKNIELKQELIGVVGQLKKYFKRQVELGAIDNLNLSDKKCCIKENKVVKSVVSSKEEKMEQKSGMNRNKEKALNGFFEAVKNCRKCQLSKTRHNVVFGSGDAEASLMFVGEAPGYDEDMKGFPFVGAAGKLLSEIMKTAGIKRESVYIANIIKCRPPMNRFPQPKEVEMCMPYLMKQIEIIKPKIICTLGACATMSILNKNTSIGSLRGKEFDYNGIKVIPTYHPAFCLRNPSSKKIVMQDLIFAKKSASING